MHLFSTCSVSGCLRPALPTCLCHVKVALRSEAGPQTRKGLLTGDTHARRVTLMGFTCRPSACLCVCVPPCVGVCASACVCVCVCKSLTRVKVGVGEGKSKGQRLGVKGGQRWHEPGWQLILEVSLAESRGEELAAG